MIRTLLRLPSPNFEQDLLTGAPPIDAYLQQLDAGLIGAKSVRRLTLLDARDFLLEASEQAASDSRDQAIKEAIAAFGDPATIARRQRADRGRVCRRWAAVYVLLFLAMIALLAVFDSDVRELGWVWLAIAGLLTGLWAGAWTALSLAPAIPTNKAADAEGFVVAFQPWLRTYTLLVWFPFIGVAVLGTFFVTGIVSKSGLLLLFFGPVGLALGLGIVTFQVEVNGHQLRIHRWQGSYDLRLDQIISFERLPWRYWLVTVLPGWPYRLRWFDDSCRTRQVILSLDMDRLQNADRLESVLALAAESATAR